MKQDWDWTLPTYNEWKHWPSWKDVTGREFFPGDFVAVWRQHHLDVAYVRRINRLTSGKDPQPITGRRVWDGEKWSDGPPGCTVTFTKITRLHYGLARDQPRPMPRQENATPEKIVKLGVTLSDMEGLSLPEYAIELWNSHKETYK